MQSKTIRNQVKAIWSILMMLTFWIVINTTKINSLVDLDRTVDYLKEIVVRQNGQVNNNK